MPRVAVADFARALALSRELIALEAAYADPPSPAEARKVEALRGGSLVLMVAALERYLRALFAEHLGRLLGPPPLVAFGALPEKLRVASVFNGLNLAMRGPRHGRAPGKVARLPSVIQAADRVAQGLVDIDALSQTRGSPDAAQVGAMLSCLALRDPFAVVRPEFETRWGRSEATTYVADKLDEIVSKRHVVAHTATILNVSRADLASWPTFLETFAEALDVVVDNQMVAIIAGTAGA